MNTHVEGHQSWQDKAMSIASCSWCHQPIELSWRKCLNSKANSFVCPHCGRSSTLLLKGEILANAYIVGMFTGIAFSWLVRQALGISPLTSVMMIIVGYLLVSQVIKLAENYLKAKHGILL